MTDLTNVSTDDLFAALRDRGIYTVIALSADDILDEAEMQEVEVSEQNAKDAAEFIWNAYDVMPELMAIRDAGLRRAVEYKNGAEV